MGHGSFRDALKRNLAAGLFVVVPFLLTIFVTLFIINQFDRLLIPDMVAQWVGFRIPGLGLLLLIVVTVLMGALARNLMGRKLLQWNERLLAKIPLAGAVYHGSKQLMNAVFMKEGRAFRQVVLLEFPRPGIYSLGFVTGDAVETLQSAIGDPAVSVFVPTTPNPTSGFFVLVKKSEIRPLAVSIPEAFRLIISAGIVSGDERNTPLHGPTSAN